MQSETRNMKWFIFVGVGVFSSEKVLSFYLSYLLTWDASFFKSHLRVNSEPELIGKAIGYFLYLWNRKESLPKES